eukprot:scaffold2574_cov110-Isochrysis_galbana.AAC.8
MPIRWAWASLCSLQVPRRRHTTTRPRPAIQVPSLHQPTTLCSQTGRGAEPKRLKRTCTRVARSEMPLSSRACDCSKAPTDAASPVSNTHIPDELLATMPPIMHESIEAGSGPILYCVSSECFFLYAARMRFTSPPIRPGSSVICLPPLSIWYLRHALPLCESLSKTESVMAWPESDVPAARKVTGVLYRRADASTSTTSSSVLTRTTACGLSL